MSEYKDGATTPRDDAYIEDIKSALCGTDLMRAVIEAQAAGGPESEVYSAAIEAALALPDEKQSYELSLLYSQRLAQLEMANTYTNLAEIENSLKLAALGLSGSVQNSLEQVLPIASALTNRINQLAEVNDSLRKNISRLEETLNQGGDVPEAVSRLEEAARLLNGAQVESVATALASIIRHLPQLEDIGQKLSFAASQLQDQRY